MRHDRWVPKPTLMRRIQVLSTLLEPTRRRLYRHVASRRRLITRDDAADSLGITRAAAAFHLDRLVAAGLLRAQYSRLSGGPALGAGRPSKLYGRSRRRFEVTIPQREPQLMSGLLAEAMSGAAAGRTVDDVGHDFGRSLGLRARARVRNGTDAGLAGCVEDVMVDLGFEPTRTETGALWARNCPFDPVSRRHPSVVCRTTIAMVRGVIDGVGAHGIEVWRDERPGWCCVIQGAGDGAGDGSTTPVDKTASRM
jgi:predicted ArsR family transcriptional regulator